MKFFSTVIVVVVVIFISAALGGKQSKGIRSTRRSDPNSTNVLSDAATDSQKTLAEWLQLPKESLVLRCSNLHLVSRGSVNILANRLFTYYPPAALSTTALPSSNNITVPSTVPPVILLATLALYPTLFVRNFEQFSRQGILQTCCLLCRPPHRRP